MQRPERPRPQSNPQPSEFEAALRQSVPLLWTTDVAISSDETGNAVAIPGTPAVPAFDPDRKVTWTVNGSAVRFDLAALLAKPAVDSGAALTSANAVVQWVGGTLCMLARSTESPSRFLFSADSASTYAVAITESSIDVEPWARRSSTEQIPAAKLRAAQGLTPAQVDARIDALDHRIPAAQRALAPVREWSLEAIQKTDPHLVRLNYDDVAQKYRGEEFSVSADGRVKARLDYVRAGTSDNSDAGKYLVTTSPADTSRTLANLFPEGTVNALIVQVGASAEAAMTDRKSIEEVVKDNRVTTTLAMVSKTAHGVNHSALDSEDTAYVKINFRLTGGVVTGWHRDRSKDVPATVLRTASSDISPAALAVVQNGVILVGDGYSDNIYAFRKGNMFLPANITEIGFSHVTGMSYNRASNKLAITLGGYKNPIKVFKLTKPGAAGQTRAEVPGDKIEGSKLAVGGYLSVWCMAWHDDELWVIDRRGSARVFKEGSQVSGKNVTLPGTEQIFAATFVGDVLIYGGDGATVYAYNVVTHQEVPGLALTGSQVRAGLPRFGSTLLSAAYDPGNEILYLGGWGDHLVAFAATKNATAFPEALYERRSMSRTRLQAETLDAPAGDAERAFKVVVSEQQPAAVARLKTLTFEEDNTNQSRYEVATPFTGITSIVFDARAGNEQYKYQVWMRSSDAQGDGIPEVIKVGSLEYTLEPSSLGGDPVAAFVTPAVASAARVSDGTLRRQIDLRYADGSWANGLVTSEPRTLTNTQLKDALGAGADPVAQAGNTDRWPLAKVPIVKMTQAQYDAATAAGTISQDILYVLLAACGAAVAPDPAANP